MLPDALAFTTYRLTIAARDNLRLPPYKGSTLRGGFGMNFKRMVCFQPQVKSCAPCLLRHNCPYPYLFESFPPMGTEVLRKNEHIAHPLVIEPPLDNRMEYKHGESLTFHLTLIGRAQQFLAYLVVAFQELGRAGLGRDRGRFRVARVEAVHPLTGATAVAFDESRPDDIVIPHLPVTAAEVEAHAAKLLTDEIHLRFLTPTRLIQGGDTVERPPFHALARRLLDRVDSLSYFHCGERWQVDFRALGEQAEGIEMAECHTRWMQVERFSGRQQERVSLGGFVGDVTYRGELGPFRSLLLLGSLIHVGKATIFGNGLYRIATGDRDSEAK